MAEPISDKNIIPTPPLEASAEFALPLDLEARINYYVNDPDDEDADLAEHPDGPVYVSVDIDDFGSNDPGDPIQVGVPQDISIASQRVRFAPDGTAFVDVILEFPDIPGAVTYEVRVAT